MAAQTDPLDPNDPAAIIRARALAQSAVTDPTQLAGTSTAASTPSPTFTSGAPAPADTSTTQPVPGGTQPGPTPPPVTFHNTIAPPVGIPQPGATFQPGDMLTGGKAGTYGAGSFNDPSADPMPIFQQILAQNAGNPQAAIDWWLKNGDKGSLAPKWYPDTKTIGLANGTYLVAPGTGGNTGTGWQVVQRGPEGQPTPTTGLPGSVNGATLTAQPNPFLDQIRQMLMQRLATDSQPVDPNDPNIAQAMSAASDQASRSSDQERKVLAERLYAQGGGNVDGAQLTQQIQQSAEKNALGLGSLKAQLITQALTAKRQDLSDAMQLAIASGDSESARSIQLQLAALNAEIQREGIGANLAISTTNANANTVQTARG